VVEFSFVFTSSGEPTSFPIGDSGITGIDQSGAATPVFAKLGGGVHLLLTEAKTDAELRSLMEAFIQRHGGNARGDAGGFRSQASLQVAAVETPVPETTP
jgi:hypothetical protein